MVWFITRCRDILKSLIYILIEHAVRVKSIYNIFIENKIIKKQKLSMLLTFYSMKPSIHNNIICYSYEIFLKIYTRYKKRDQKRFQLENIRYYLYQIQYIAIFITLDVYM